MHIPDDTRELPSISAVHCRLFVRHAQKLGADPALLLERVGLRVSSIADHRVRISIGALEQLMQTCALLASDEDVGLHVGATVTREDVDLIGLHPRIGQLSPAAALWLATHGDRRAARDFEVHRTPEGVVLRQVQHPRHATPRVLGEYFAARIATVVRPLGYTWRPLGVRFMHPRPAKLVEHARVFGSTPVSFGEAHNELVLSADLLAAGGAPWARVMAASLVPGIAGAVRKDSADEPFIQRVRGYIQEHLAGGQLCFRFAAQLLCQNERTLRRKLRLRGTSYQALVDDVRLQLAMKYLEQELAPSDIARLLGYSEQTALYRAFKHWTGQSIATFRQNRERSGVAS